MESNLHRYTTEQVLWMKNCVLPKHKEAQSLADQFNERFGTNLSAGAVYSKAKRVQSKKGSPLSQGNLKKKLHRYTSEQEEFIRKEYPAVRGRPRKVDLLRKKFNRRFKTNIITHTFGQKCSFMYREDKAKSSSAVNAPIHSPVLLSSLKEDTKVEFVVFVDGCEVWRGECRPNITLQDCRTKEL